MLGPKPPNANVVRSVWLFRHKYYANGSLSSLVVEPATIQTVFSLAMSRGWPVHHLDVKNSFLNGDLLEIVYMYQPLSFVDPRFLHHGSLERAHMVSCNPFSTPVDTESKLGPDWDRVSDPTLYWSLAGIGLQLFASSTASLIAYSDADWLGCPSTRWSAFGYYVFLGDNFFLGLLSVRVLHVSSHYQYAGIFTEGLPSALFEEFCTVPV
ncbi:ribonuclease H-like domain-containing protein [Tanacetum coccineum]